MTGLEDLIRQTVFELRAYGAVALAASSLASYRLAVSIAQEVHIPKDERRYSENEFALILRKALDLQDRQSGGSFAESAEGLSLEEIKAVAREVGLDSALVERAAASLPTTAETTAARIFGGPSKYQLEYRAPGQLSKEDLGRVIDAVRQATGHQGKVTEVPGSLEWRTEGELSQIHLTVSPREGETSVKVIADRGPAGALVFGLLGAGGGLVSMGIVGAIIEPTSVFGVSGIVAACLGGALFTARTVWVTTTKGFRSRLRGLMGATSKAIDESVEA